MTEPAPAATPDPRTSRRSMVPFIVIGAAAIVLGIANWVGSLGFPPNAPVEQIEAFGLTIDFVALVILAVIGVLVARQPIAVKPTSVLALVGMCLTALVLLIAAFAWVMGLGNLADGRLLHYSDEVWLTFLFAPVAITGLAFSAFAFRVPRAMPNNLFSILGIVFGLVVFALGAFSAVIYGLGLTT